jgi:hypothetical protein
LHSRDLDRFGKSAVGLDKGGDFEVAFSLFGLVCMLSSGGLIGV